MTDLKQTLTTLIFELAKKREMLTALELVESGNAELGVDPVDVSAQLAAIRGQVEALAAKLKVPVVYKP